jgi:hypothetical protein
MSQPDKSDCRDRTGTLHYISAVECDIVGAVKSEHRGCKVDTSERRDRTRTLRSKKGGTSCPRWYGANS